MITVNDLKVGQKLITSVGDFTNENGEVVTHELVEVITSITEKRVNTETFRNHTTSTGRSSSKAWLSIKTTLKNINSGITRIE